MKYLAIKSDSKDVYIGLWEDSKELESKSWEAGRELSQQILSTINSILNNFGMSNKDLDKIVVYEGPGSYTGLRISISVVNALGYANNILVVGSTSENWIELGVKKDAKSKHFTPISPVYGGEVFTTKPRK